MNSDSEQWAYILDALCKELLKDGVLPLNVRIQLVGRKRVNLLTAGSDSDDEADAEIVKQLDKDLPAKTTKAAKSVSSKTGLSVKAVIITANILTFLIIGLFIANYGTIFNVIVESNFPGLTDCLKRNHTPIDVASALIKKIFFMNQKDEVCTQLINRYRDFMYSKVIPAVYGVIFSGYVSTLKTVYNKDNSVEAVIRAGIAMPFKLSREVFIGTRNIVADALFIGLMIDQAKQENFKITKTVQKLPAAAAAKAKSKSKSSSNDS
jgi:hypothetical protein